MTVAIIDYGSGNLRSAAKAFERAARDRGRTVVVEVTADPDRVLAADHIVLPGVGAFADCKAGLDALPGMIEALEAAVIDGGRPFMGICVGMQLMSTTGREYGEHPGLGWIPGEVVALTRDRSALKVPHMGWNQLEVRQPNHPVLAALEPGCHAYFVHSYHFSAAEAGHVLAEVDYGGPLAAIIGRDNMVGTQFHPEKSQSTGLSLIAAFLDWAP